MRLAWTVAFIVLAACGGDPPRAELGEPCGGLEGIRCVAGGYCQMPYNTCDGPEMGVCHDLGLCDSTSTPVCGCDGEIYDGYCLAAVVGADELGRCTPREGTFACGSGFCDLATEYCIVAYFAETPDLPRHGCEALPAACNGTASCDCLDDIVCTDSQQIATCTDESPGFRVTCPSD
jgi:hypothetical protein